MKLQSTYNVGIYCRLSRDDNKGNTESMSISNQRQMLLSYIQERGWRLGDVYIDDGYSGTTFERPDFQRLIGDIETRKIDLVITKDLSRLGRNYVMTGQYTDFFFPQHRVRYIAVNDNYDSQNTDNDIAPFKNILNEMYAKDISKKIRSSRQASAKQGKFMGSQPPYGYTKSPENKYLLIPDEEAAKVVKRLFDLFAKGDSGRHIACILNSEKLSPPAVYFYNKLDKPRPNPKISTTWGSGTILQLFKNQVYIGNMVQCKRSVTSFKTGKRHLTSKDEWIVVENTHEPIIDLETWETVQARLRANVRNRVCHTGEISLFAGIVRCADCGSAMVFNKKFQRGKTYIGYKCSRYANQGKQSCSIHSINLSTLSEAVLQDIRNNAKLAVDDRDSLINSLMKLGNREQEEKRIVLEKKLCEAKSRIKALDNLIKKLFEERATGNIPDSIFKKLMSDYEAEQNNLSDNVSISQSDLAKLSRSTDCSSQWIDRISGFTQINELNRDIVTDLIDSIEVSERYELENEKHQNIQIKYKFIGSINN